MKKVEAYRCHAVYKDYDGNAPDTQNLVFCATKELAIEIAKLITDEEEREIETGEEGNMLDYVSRPNTEGKEWCSSYQTRDAIAEEKDIITSIEDFHKRCVGS